MSPPALRWSWMRYPFEMPVSPIVSESLVRVILYNTSYVSTTLAIKITLTESHSRCHFNTPSFTQWPREQKCVTNRDSGTSEARDRGKVT